MIKTTDSRSSSYFSLLVILALASFLYLPWLDDNHKWWGDFALYMAHARNIAEGLPYANTGYVMNPYMAWLSPPAYPPVFSYLLAPIYQLFGLNLLAPKIFNFLNFLVLIVLFHQFCVRRLENGIAVFGVTLALAASPWFWDMKNLILSDIPFVMFTFASVLTACKVSSLEARSRGYWLWPVLLGTMFYLAYGTRSLGIVLPVTLLAFDLVKSRKIHLSSIIALAVFMGCYGLQNLFLDIDKSYANAMVEHAIRDSGEAPAGIFERGTLFLQYMLGNLMDRSWEYTWILQAYWDNGTSLLLRLAVTLLTSLLAVAGFVSAVRKNLSFTEVFVVVYLSVLLVVPFIQGYRYLLPLIPFLLFYIYLGAEEAATFIKSGYAVYTPMAVTVLVVISHLGFYAAQFPQQAIPGVKDKEAGELFAFIRQATSDDELIIHDKPRVIALFTGRRSSVFLPDHNAAELWAYFDSVDASYLIFNTKHPIADFENYDALMHDPGERLILLFKNDAFKLYRINPLPN